MSTIDLLRHGEPRGGVRYRGDGVDDPLSERGWEQMWAAVAQTSDWTHVVTSPLRRCREFAEVLATRSDIPLVVDTRLREVGFGAWEGRRHDEVRDADPAAYLAFFRDAVNHRPPGAEPLDTFYRPRFRVDSRFESAFSPTMLTDATGRLNDEIGDDVALGRVANAPPKKAVAGA